MAVPMVSPMKMSELDTRDSFVLRPGVADPGSHRGSGALGGESDAGPWRCHTLARIAARCSTMPTDGRESHLAVTRASRALLVKPRSLLIAAGHQGPSGHMAWSDGHGTRSRRRTARTPAVRRPYVGRAPAVRRRGSRRHGPARVPRARGHADTGSRGRADTPKAGTPTRTGLLMHVPRRIPQRAPMALRTARRPGPARPRGRSPVPPRSAPGAARRPGTPAPRHR